MRGMLLVTLNIAISAVAPHRALAQPAGVVPRAVTPLSSLRRDAVVRVSMHGRYTVGRFTRLTDDSLYLVTMAVPVATLDSVWVQGRATRTGAKVGGLLGGLSFTALGLLLGAAMCIDSKPGECNAGGVVVGTAAVGVIAGAVIGAGLGSLGHVWRRVHP